MKNIRNIAVMGHAKCGKTTITEAMLFNAGQVKRLGSIADGTTISDYDNEENDNHRDHDKERNDRRKDPHAMSCVPLKPGDYDGLVILICLLASLLKPGRLSCDLFCRPLC